MSAMIFLAGLVIWKVPLYLHHPLCVGRPADGQTIASGVHRSLLYDDAHVVEGDLADHYLEIFTDALKLWDVTFVEIDGMVFIRLWDRITDPHSLIFNADGKTIDYLGDPEDGHPIWDEMPEDVRHRLLQIRRGEVDAPHCEFVRTIFLTNWGGD